MGRPLIAVALAALLVGFAGCASEPEPQTLEEKVQAAVDGGTPNVSFELVDQSGENRVYLEDRSASEGELLYDALRGSLLNSVDVAEASFQASPSVLKVGYACLNGDTLLMTVGFERQGFDAQEIRSLIESDEWDRLEEVCEYVRYGDFVEPRLVIGEKDFLKVGAA